jgi:hypothetical protein
VNPFINYTDAELQALELCLKADVARRVNAAKTQKGTKRKVRTVAGEYTQTFELNGATHEVLFSVAVSPGKKVSDSKFGNRLATVLAYDMVRKALGIEFNGATEKEEKRVANLADALIALHGSTVTLQTDISPAVAAAYKVQREATFPSTIPKGRTSFHGVDQLVTS